jgi:hypothetical protein
MGIRYALFVICFATLCLAGDDIDIPLLNGHIRIVNPRFLRDNGYGSTVPELSYTLVNESGSPWKSLRLRFQILYVCKDKANSATQDEGTSLGWDSSTPVSLHKADSIIPLVGSVQGCYTDKIHVTLLSAENVYTKVDGPTGEKVDLDKEMADAEDRARRLDEDKKAEQTKRQAAEAKDAAAMAAKEKQDAAAEAKARAQREAAKLEAIRRAKLACIQIYKDTADKRVGDLTVKEEQAVRACQNLGLYSPQ